MKIADLKPADYNPRTISTEQLQRLKKSLDEFGDLSGIIFNRQTGNLVGGHQRLKLLPPDATIKKTDLKSPTRSGTVADGYVIIDGEKLVYREVDWDIVREKAANIAANKHGGEWEDDKLNALIAELVSYGTVDMDLTGYDNAEITAIMDALNAADEAPEEAFDADTALETTETRYKAGDLILMGTHRLLCGDSTNPADVTKLLMGGGTASYGY